MLGRPKLPAPGSQVGMPLVWPYCYTFFPFSKSEGMTLYWYLQLKQLKDQCLTLAFQLPTALRMFTKTCACRSRIQSLFRNVLHFLSPYHQKHLYFLCTRVLLRVYYLKITEKSWKNDGNHYVLSTFFSSTSIPITSKH